MRPARTAHRAQPEAWTTGNARPDAWSTLRLISAEIVEAKLCFSNAMLGMSPELAWVGFGGLDGTPC